MSKKQYNWIQLGPCKRRFNVDLFTRSSCIQIESDSLNPIDFNQIEENYPCKQDLFHHGQDLEGKRADMLTNWFLSTVTLIFRLIMLHGGAEGTHSKSLLVQIPELVGAILCGSCMFPICMWDYPQCTLVSLPKTCLLG